MYFTVDTLCLPHQNQKEIAPGPSLQEFSEISRGKTHKSMGYPLRLWPPGVSYLCASPHLASGNFKKLPSKHCFQVRILVAFAGVSRSQL